MDKVKKDHKRERERERERENLPDPGKTMDKVKKDHEGQTTKRKNKGHNNAKLWQYLLKNPSIIKVC